MVSLYLLGGVLLHVDTVDVDISLALLETVQVTFMSSSCSVMYFNLEPMVVRFLTVQLYVTLLLAVVLHSRRIVQDPFSVCHVELWVMTGGLSIGSNKTFKSKRSGEGCS